MGSGSQSERAAREGGQTRLPVEGSRFGRSVRGMDSGNDSSAPQSDQGRSLSRAQRALVYGTVGVAMEVVFTGVAQAFHRDRADWKLQGHSYLWMLPLYGALTAYAYEPVRDSLRNRPVPVRAAAYAAGTITLEYASGRLLKRTVGVIPWDYTGHGQFVRGGGATRLDYAPLWAVAGMVAERLSDRLRRRPTPAPELS